MVGGSSLALSEEDIGHVSRAAVLAGGASKAEAILAVLRHHPHKLLVTDEGAAMKMMGILRQQPSF